MPDVPPTRELRYSQALNEALREEMERDAAVVLIGEDIGAAGGSFRVTQGLCDRFGADRVIDTPIAENALVGLAVGAAATGLRPVVEIMFMDFLALCLDQILNQAAKMHYMSGGQVTLPLVIRTPGGAGLSAGPQHSQSLEAVLMHVPGLKVVMPATPRDAKGLLKAAIRDPNPVVVIENKALYGQKGAVSAEDFVLPLGRADIKRVGTHVTLIALGQMLSRAIGAAARLSEQEIEVEIVDPMTLSPLDMETIVTSVRKTGHVVIAHEAVRQGGAGAELVARLGEEAFDYLDAPIERIAAPFTPVPYSPDLERHYLPSEDAIFDAVLRTIVRH
jgi:acetoin:2,6-dichlorophenolindophenol oxidoreductase subunit beta